MDGPVGAAPEGPAVARTTPQAQAPRDISGLVAELRRIVGDEWVYTAEHQLRTYESDGLLQYHGDARGRRAAEHAPTRSSGSWRRARARRSRGSRAAPARGSAAARCRSRTAC